MDGDDFIDLADPTDPNAFDHAIVSQNGSVSAGVSQRTRARNWTFEETSLLITAKKLEYDKYKLSTYWGRMVTAEERWGVVVQFLNENGVIGRDSKQCKQKWENLLSDYKVIKELQQKPDNFNYFTMSRDDRRRAGAKVPLQFDDAHYAMLDEFFGRRPSLAYGGNKNTSEQSSARSILGGNETEPAGKRRKTSTSEVASTIRRMSASYIGVLADIEDKRDERHRERMDLEREKLEIERERLERESQDRRDLCLALGKLASVFRDVASSLREF